MLLFVYSVVGAFMKYFVVASGLVSSLILTACVNSHDPAMTAASKGYFPQSITVIESKKFVAGLAGFGGGTPEELAAEFANNIQSVLKKDLPSIMRGQLPAKVTVQLDDIEIGPSVFASPTSGANGTVSITDAVSGTIVAQLPVHVDNSDTQMNSTRDPVAGLAAVLILKAVVPSKNLGLWELANKFRTKVKMELGGSGF